ncbi:hypothetical protein M885DRAFT_611362 [Pelagophyceae sp. CCMP2097]|nr:hypothetical protein M885DRAFT_611362 [Pelagophyceae sp. CCMP2097]
MATAADGSGANLSSRRASLREVQAESAHSLLVIKELRSSTERGLTELDLLQETNVMRIQHFLDAPFDRAGEAQAGVLRRLRVRGVALGDALTTHPLPLKNAPQPGAAADAKALAVQRACDDINRGLGPRSRFADGDGSFWDRWLNDTGCLGPCGSRGAEEKYLPPTRPVHPGFLRPMQGFKAPVADEDYGADGPPPATFAAMPEATVERLKVAYEAKQAKERGRGAWATAVPVDDDAPLRRGADDDDAVSPADVRAALDVLDRSSVEGNGGAWRVCLAGAGFDARIARAVKACLLRARMTLPVESLDVSGMTTDLPSVLVLGGACGPALTALDASQLHLDAAAVAALARGLSSEHRNLKIFKLRDCALDDRAAVRIFAALRRLEFIEQVDVSRNSLGSVSSLAVRRDDFFDEQDTKYFEKWVGGPAGGILSANKSSAVPRAAPGPLMASQQAKARLRFTQGSKGDSVLGLPKLKKYVLDSNLLGLEAAIGLAVGMASHSFLEHLSLASNAVGDAGAAWLARGATMCATLTHLDVSDNGITAVGAIVLSRLARDAKRLSVLDVSRNVVGLFGGAELLALALDVPHLEVKAHGCGTVAAPSDDALKYDWLHGVALPLAAHESSAPPQDFEFDVGDALQRALCLHVLAGSARGAGLVAFRACHVRHVVRAEKSAAFDKAVAAHASVAATKFGLGSASARDLTGRVRDANVRSPLDAKLDARTSFCTLEHQDATNADAQLLRRAADLEREGSRELAKGADFSPLDAAGVRALLEQLSAGAGALAERCIAECDWDDSGFLERRRVLRFAVDAAAAVSAEARTSAPLWAVKASATFFEAPVGQMGGIAEGKFVVPTAGTVTLRFQLGDRTGGWGARMKEISAIVKLAEALSPAHALKLAAAAHVELGLADALDLSRQLCSLHSDSARIVADVLCVTGPKMRAARAFRDAALRENPPQRPGGPRDAFGDLLEGRHALRRLMGAQRYRAISGPRAGRYTLNLSREGDRATLRLLLRDDVTAADAGWEGSQCSHGSRCRNVRVDAIRMNRGFFGSSLIFAGFSHLSRPASEPQAGRKARWPNFAHVLEAEDGAPPTLDELHSLFSESSVDYAAAAALAAPALPGSAHAAEDARAARPLGLRRSGIVTFDYAPRPPATSATHHRTVTTAQLAAYVARLGWLEATRAADDAPPAPLSPKASTGDLDAADELRCAFTRDVGVLADEVRSECSTAVAALRPHPLGGDESATRALAALYDLRYPGAEPSEGAADVARAARPTRETPRQRRAAAQASAGAACDAMRRTREARQFEAPTMPARRLAFGTRLPDRALADALDLAAAVPGLSEAQAVALLLWCPLADDGGRPVRPARLGRLLAAADALTARAPESAADDEAWARERDACSSRRVALAVALVDKVRAPSAACLLRPLTVPERAEVLFRCGHLAFFDAKDCDGVYCLDLSARDDRAVAKCLVDLEAKEPGADWLEFDCCIQAVQPVCTGRGWKEIMPTSGVYSFRFASQKDGANAALREALAQTCTARVPAAAHDDDI